MKGYIKRSGLLSVDCVHPRYNKFFNGTEWPRFFVSRFEFRVEVMFAKNIEKELFLDG